MTVSKLRTGEIDEQRGRAGRGEQGRAPKSRSPSCAIGEEPLCAPMRGVAAPARPVLLAVPDGAPGHWPLCAPAGGGRQGRPRPQGEESRGAAGGGG